jgi:hypothetical protein
LAAKDDDSADPVAYYNLKNRALDDPQAFLDVDLHDHLGEIGARDLATLDQLQQSLRSGNHDPQIDLERVYKGNIDRTLRGLDLSATDIANIHHQVDRDLAGYQAATGRKATPAEQQQMADQAVMNMKLDQRGFVMTRYGAIISIAGKRGSSWQVDGVNPALNMLDKGYLQQADVTNRRDSMPDNVQQRSLSNSRQREQIRPGERQNQDNGNAEGEVSTEIIAPWLKEGARETFKGILPYPSGSVKPSYIGERKTMGLLAKEAEEAIWTLQPAKIWPVAGDHKLNTRIPPTADGRYSLGQRKTAAGKDRPHSGIDITAKVGERVNVVKDGTVVWVREEIYPDGKRASISRRSF